MRLLRRLTPTLLLTLLSAAVQAQVDRTETLRSSSIDRTYTIHLPADLPSEAPLVVVLHGYTGKADPNYFGMNATADRHGFAVCYPQGERDGRGKTCWNVGYPFQADMRIDDVKFLSDLVRHLQRRYGLSRHNVFCTGMSNGGDMCYGLSRHNVFCTGMSNGGDMCYLLASKRPDLFAALGPVAGFMSVEILRGDKCRRPVPLFEIHGTADPTTRWEGDLENRDGWGAYLPIPMAVSYWAARNKCLEHRIDTLPRRESQLQVVAHRYTDGTDGHEVWLYETIGGRHSWRNTGVDTCEELWRFFSRWIR